MITKRSVWVPVTEAEDRFRPYSNIALHCGQQCFFGTKRISRPRPIVKTATTMATGTTQESHFFGM